MTIEPSVNGKGPFNSRTCRAIGFSTIALGPFATTALGRLSTLSVWWIRLGILPDLIAPASPQQNGRHGRLHRTLKAEATRPPSANLQTPQIRFDRFRHKYNDEHPHEALDQDTPSSVYQASPRALPRTLAPLEDPGHFEVRLVSVPGLICHLSSLPGRTPPNTRRHHGTLALCEAAPLRTGAVLSGGAGRGSRRRPLRKKLPATMWPGSGLALTYSTSARTSSTPPSVLTWMT